MKRVAAWLVDALIRYARRDPYFHLDGYMERYWPTAAGTTFAGGLFVARYYVGVQAFALVVSPKDEGDLKPRKWGPLSEPVAGAQSYVDGLANTDAMIAAGNKLAAQVRALRTGGFDDWYLPSRLESLLLFGELQGEFERDWYWTSTQDAAYGEFAWIQNFDGGHQGFYRKDTHCRARAVRRVPI